MAIKIPWDRYEAVILLEAWLQVKSGVPKPQMINLVSYQLRTKAVNQGLEIDDIFRNTNGITFQMMSMATAYEQKDMGKTASRLFSEIANLYRTNYNAYQKLKEEALKMIEYPSKNKDAFIDYVNSKNADNAVNIINAVDAMVDFSISTKVLSRPIYDDLTIDAVSVLRKKVIKHKFFVVRYKKILPFAEIGLRFLEDYAKTVPIPYDVSNSSENIDTTADSTVFNGSKSHCTREDKAQVGIVSDEIRDKYGPILMQEFEEGYCIGDYMHRMRFRSAYEEKYSGELDKTADEIENILKKIGQVRGERIFYSDGTESTVLSDMYEDIREKFDNGATAVYYECLYDNYSERLATEMSIYSADTLRSAIQGDAKFPKEYRAMKSYIAKYGIDADSNAEVRKVLQSCHVPVTSKEIQTKLRHIPLDKIKLALRQIPDSAHIDESTYFYAPNFYISSEEKIALIRAMRSAISANGFLVAKDLRDIFRTACPSSAMDSEQYKDSGIRNILKVLLRDEFEFSSSVITEKGVQLDYGQLFENYAADRERVTLNELLELKKKLGSPVIYWNSVFKEMIRISKTEMVRKGTVRFDIAATDRVLEEMYPDEYTPLKDITLFLSLPPASVRWNGFLLESFLREYSEKFRLVQLSIAQDDYYGVMLRQSSALEGYFDVAADMLAKNHSWSDEKSALQLLKDMNFQQRAVNVSISAIIKAAKQKRLNID